MSAPARRMRPGQVLREGLAGMSPAVVRRNAQIQLAPELGARLNAMARRKATLDERAQAGQEQRQRPARDALYHSWSSNISRQQLAHLRHWTCALMQRGQTPDMTSPTTRRVALAWGTSRATS